MSFTSKETPLWGRTGRARRGFQEFPPAVLRCFDGTTSPPASRALLEKIPESQRPQAIDRGALKQYQGLLSIWIDERGVPLASRTRIDASGRAFIIIRFRFEIESELEFDVSDGRLVAEKEIYHQLSQGAGERSERRMVKTLEVHNE